MSDDYEIGYGKPPKMNQWLAGQSGNPRGSSRKARKTKALMPLDEMLIEELAEPVEPTMNGKRCRMPGGKALVKMMMRDALNGTARDRREFSKLVEGKGMSDLMRRQIETRDLDDDDRLSPAESKLLELIAAEEAEWAAMSDEKKAEHARKFYEDHPDEEEIADGEEFTGRAPERDEGHLADQRNCDEMG